VRKLEDDLDVLLFDRRGHRPVDTGGPAIVAGGPSSAAGRQRPGTARQAHRRRARNRAIVLNSLIPFDKMLPVIDAFDRENPAPGCASRPAY
jgi:DNA-binding transcriptional LysR family regulator